MGGGVRVVIESPYTIADPKALLHLWIRDPSLLPKSKRYTRGADPRPESPHPNLALA